jgi:hypothetical protein
MLKTKKKLVSKKVDGKLPSDAPLLRLQKSLGVLTKMYPTDDTSPGIVLSMVPGDQYYCSLVRYEEKYGRGKVVVRSATKPSLVEAIDSAVDDFLSAISSALKNRRDRGNG